MTDSRILRSSLFADDREKQVLFILFGLSLGVRLYMVFHTYVITNDGTLYIKLAKLISKGAVTEALSLWLPNLYPLALAFFQRVFFDWELSGQMVSTVFGSLAIIPFYFLVRSLFSRDVALVASILFAFHPYAVRFSAEVIRGPTFWFLLMMTLWVGWEAIGRKRLWLFVVSGIFGSLSFLVRPEGIFVLPLLAAWTILADVRTLRATYKKNVRFALVLLLVVPVVLSPAILYLKQKTGRWNWARAEQIPGITLSDLTMKEIKRNFDKVEVKSWDNGPQVQIESSRLKIFLSLAREQRLSIIVIETLNKFLKAMHPLLVIPLIFGAFRRKRVEYRMKEEVFLFSILVAFLLMLIRYGTVFIYISTRHVMVPVILCLPWAGVGVIEVEQVIRNAFQAAKFKGESLFGLKYLRWALVVAIVVALLPKTLASQRIDKIPIREAGIWIKENGPENPVVMGQDGLARVGFYAEGTFIGIPRNQDLIEFSKKRKVDFLALNQKDIENTRRGLTRFLDSEHFKEEIAFGTASGPYLIRIYSVRN
ncbi:MAG: hypothetical protein GTO24_11085 [candidate division Zixibacteria bacterium]|nr:hypothetical protein [candidate division Zixibacteria bacterium]